MSPEREIDFGSLATEAPPPPLRPEVLAVVGDAPPPVRPVWPVWARVGLAAAAGAVVSLVAISAFTTRAAPTFLGGLWVGAVLLWIGVTLGLTWLAVAEADPRVSERSWPKVAGLAIVTLAFVAYALAEDLLGDGAIALPGGSELWQGAKTCFAMGSVLELGPVLVIFFLLVRGATFRPVRAGLLGGVAAGGWSVLVLSIHCPSASVLHVVPFHLGVALLWGLLGAGVGLLLKRRAASRFPFPRGEPEGRVEARS